MTLNPRLPGQCGGVQTLFCLKLSPFSCCYREERLFHHTFSIGLLLPQGVVKSVWLGLQTAGLREMGRVYRLEIKEIRAWKIT